MQLKLNLVSTIIIATVDVNKYQGTTTETMNLTVSHTTAHTEMTIPAALATIQSTATLQQQRYTTDKGESIGIVEMLENDAGGG